MAYTFLKAQASPWANRWSKMTSWNSRRSSWRSSASKLVLPVDHVVAAELKEGAENETVDYDSRRQDGARHRSEDDRRIFAAMIAWREDDHLERTDGRVREAAVR